MITEDDARHTVELPDRYVIEPEFAWWSREDLPQPAKPVPEGFRYSSDANDLWLTPAALQNVLSEAA
jgi:UDP-N-acetylglucosamine 4,6-dehydratase